MHHLRRVKSMNMEIETAVAAWIGSISDLMGMAIHPGQTDEEIPNDEPVIFVACDSAAATAPSLYIASVKIIISSPVVITGSLAAHKAAVAILRSSISDSAAIANQFAQPLSCRGGSMSGWDDSRTQTHWTTEITLTLGIVDESAVI